MQQTSRFAFLELTRSPELCFTAYGGFLLLDDARHVVSVQALGPSGELKFSETHSWRAEVAAWARNPYVGFAAAPSC